MDDDFDYLVTVNEELRDDIRRLCDVIDRLKASTDDTEAIEHAETIIKALNFCPNHVDTPSRRIVHGGPDDWGNPTASYIDDDLDDEALPDTITNEIDYI